MDDLESRILSEVSLEEPWALIEAFSRMHRWQPEDVNKGVDFLVGRLEKLGIPVTVHEPVLHLSVPLEAEVRVAGQTFRAKPPGYSRAVPDGFEGELTYLRAAPKNIRSYSKRIEDLFGDAVKSVEDAKAKVRGKIVVTESFANPANTQLFEEWGACGIIAVNPGANIHWGICTTVWGTPDLDDLPRRPSIPVVAVNNPDGQKIIELAKKGESGTIVSDLREGWFMQKLPVVDIPGAEQPEKFVLLHGHLDSWEVGVGDNATGNAAKLELARVLWNNRDKLKRSVRIAWWPGHSTGRYAGSTWFSDAFAIDLDENCVAQINCDSPGCRWATSYHKTTVMAETEALALKAIADVGGRHGKGNRPHQAGDYSFNNIGISSYFMLSSTMPDDLRAEKNYYAVSGCGGNIGWHTEDDTLEIADKDILMTDMKIYLLAVWRNANADILPYDWRATAAEFLATIDTYRKAAGDRFDLTPSHQAASELAGALDGFYGAIEKNAIDAGEANDAITELARILVPVNFVRTPRFRHDPAYTTPRLPTIATAEELDDFDDYQIGFARTQLMRGQNRLIAALREAKRRVERATA